MASEMGVMQSSIRVNLDNRIQKEFTDFKDEDSLKDLSKDKRAKKERTVRIFYIL